MLYLEGENRTLIINVAEPPTMYACFFKEIVAVNSLTTHVTFRTRTNVNFNNIEADKYLSASPLIK